MTVQTVINCRPEFQLPARYTIAMLGLIAGFRPRFVQAGEADPSVPLLVYGDVSGLDGRRFAQIPEAPEGAAMFGQKRLFPPEMVSNVKVGSRTLLGFFHQGGGTEPEEGASIYRFPLDLVAAAFYFLSLHEESVIRERDQFDRFESKNALRGKLGLLDRPVVAEYGLALGEVLRGQGAALNPDTRYQGRASAICMTHDIDYLSKWSPGIAWREFVTHFLLNRARHPFPLRTDRFLAFLKSALPGRDPYKVSLDKIIEKEEELDIRGTFFFKAGGNDKRDMQYSLRQSYVRDLLEDLDGDGHVTGLHPSFNTYRDAEMWRREKENLANAAGHPIVCARQHYLRFSFPQTWRIMEENGMQYDSTLGFAEMNGFRNGTCHPFLPFDIEAGRVMRLWEVPLHVMDGTLMSYRRMTPEQSREEISRMAHIVSENRGIYTILFHNTCYDTYDFPGWSRIFEDFLESSVRQDAFLSTIPETVETWMKGAAYKDLQDLIATIES